MRMLIIGLVIPKTRLNLRYGTGSSEKSAIRNAVYSLAKFSSNPIFNYLKGDYFVRLQATFRISELTRHVL